MAGGFFFFRRVIEYFPKVLSKLPVTLNIVLVSIGIAVILATAIAAIRIKKLPVLSQLAATYVSFVRGTPILVQLFLVYYGMPLLITFFAGKNITSEWNKLIFVYIAYGLNEAGFLSEHIRAAILSVPSGQSEAGYSVGLTGVQTFFRIVLPQASRVLIPGFSTMLVGLLPATSLAYMLGVTDMMGKVKAIGTVTFHTLEGYFCAAVIFVLASFVLERIFIRLSEQLNYERKIKGA
ncbi:amino acid ABC transporter permease [Lacrimispora aerotolerans]|uniref:amino acid ABC transporter permease n=1 Tax=Lacrimispora aerotolerans TaxID=36832 RepID=UPI00054E8C93|nr:amino acid ABC transporter permease [Lacrimispora aerotolerans]